MRRNWNDEPKQAELQEHPAVKAWSRLRPARVEPTGIETLRERPDGTGNSRVYRLKGVGLGGTAVIAKRCLKTTGVIEQTVYEEILPNLPVTTPYYYGFTEEEGKCCWLFTQDVGRERYSEGVAEHRALAGRWLGQMHVSAENVAAVAHLPDRRPQHYLQLLRSTRQSILQSLTVHPHDSSDIAVLKAIVSQLDRLELGWSQVEKSCEQAPLTLVHGDFRPKNAYVRIDRDGTALFPIDWETAGLGVPAADLVRVDITAYQSVVRESWSSLDMKTVRRLANVGQVFRWLDAICWATRALTTIGMERSMGEMRIYRAEMAKAIKRTGMETQSYYSGLRGLAPGRSSRGSA